MAALCAQRSGQIVAVDMGAARDRRCRRPDRKAELDDRRAGGDVDDRDLVPARDRLGQRNLTRDVEPLAGVQVAQRGRDRIAGVDENGWVRGHGGAASLPVGAGLSSIENGVIRSEEHTSELQSLMRISYAVFCLKKQKQYRYH